MAADVPATPPAGPSLSSMYQDVLLGHYRAPHGRGPLPDATATALRRNPLCGDEIRVSVAINADSQVYEVRFEGRGCSIATASASMLTDAVQGLAIRDALALADRVDRLLAGHPDPDPQALGDLQALIGVAPFPQRIGCARMPWLALRDAVEQLPV